MLAGRGPVAVAPRAGRQLVGELEQAADGDGGGGAVALLAAAVGELQVPVGDVVGGQVGQEVVGAALRGAPGTTASPVYR